MYYLVCVTNEKERERKEKKKKKEKQKVERKERNETNKTKQNKKKIAKGGTRKLNSSEEKRGQLWVTICSLFASSFLADKAPARCTSHRQISQFSPMNR